MREGKKKICIKINKNEFSIHKHKEKYVETNDRICEKSQRKKATRQKSVSACEIKMWI